MTSERYAKLLQVLDRRQPDLTVVMENVHKPHNLAAIARSCDAVGVPEIHAATNLDEVAMNIKASSGSEKWVDVKMHPDIRTVCDELHRRDFVVLAAHFDERAVDYRTVDYTGPTAVLVGQELDGLTEGAVDQADGSIIIPMMGMVQSLNVSVATALILFEARRQREAAGMYDSPRLEKAVYDRQLFEWAHPRVAEYCRERGLTYPQLDDEGEIIRESFCNRD